ncbi:hypothetical protein ACE38W_22585 [Chitinophaga sp. Hz27]|uniref:hypothetical protein n=1 Tax=Chitinophaga sp. Hz27 TaxID=3347169 RepID=UPI0035E26F6B
MKKYLIPCCAVVFLASCSWFSGSEKTIESDSVKLASAPGDSATPANKDDRNDDGETIDMDTTIMKRLAWVNDIADAYVKSPAANELVKVHLKDSSINWIWDSLRKTDSATYVVLQVGADENNGEGMVFGTAAWLYIDTLSRKVYEYNLPNDELIPLHIPKK